MTASQLHLQDEGSRACTCKTEGALLMPTHYKNIQCQAQDEGLTDAERPSSKCSDSTNNQVDK